MLLRKLLPWYNPLQNLNDWARLAFGSAVFPPLLGGILMWLLLPKDASLDHFSHLGTVRIHWRTGVGAVRFTV